MVDPSWLLVPLAQTFKFGHNALPMDSCHRFTCSVLAHVHKIYTIRQENKAQIELSTLATPSTWFKKFRLFELYIHAPRLNSVASYTWSFAPFSCLANSLVTRDLKQAGPLFVVTLDKCAFPPPWPQPATKSFCTTYQQREWLQVFPCLLVVFQRKSTKDTSSHETWQATAEQYS